jgi:UTP--glucose-1-phosphate uridylyltransferase
MITKAVIPAAGAGTRLLPVTKAQPKEMLPILDTPAIQHVVQEAVDAGIRDILIVTGRNKRAIEDHFDRNIELEAHLEQKGDTEALRAIRQLADLARIHYVRQATQAGLGDAVRCARAFVGDDPFAVLNGDAVFDAPTPVTRQLVEVFEEHRVSVVAVEEVPPDKVHRFGIVECTPSGERVGRISRLVEKPLPEETSSNLAIAGRYVLTADIFDVLEAIPPGRNDEIQLTDALGKQLEYGSALAFTIDGHRYDVGNKLDYLETILAFALKREEYVEPLRKFAKAIAGRETDSQGR